MAVKRMNVVREREWSAECQAGSVRVGTALNLRLLEHLTSALRSGATWENGLPHSGYLHFADQDEVGGSSPPRPTTSGDKSQYSRRAAAAGHAPDDTS
jgi:hypothetical protein